MCMVNCKGGRLPELPFRVPDGWVIVRQHRGITTIRPISDVDVHGSSITIQKFVDGGVEL